MRVFILHLYFFANAVFFHVKAKSQYYFYNDDYYESAITWEAGVSAGVINCLTDLGGKKGVGKKFLKDLNWSSTDFCGSVHVGVAYWNIIGARAELSFGQVKGGDSVLRNDHSVAYGRYLRNLHFRSKIAELSFLVEFHPLLLQDEMDANFSSVSPYILAGIGIFHFNPEAKLNNRWVNLSMLHTEGQGFAKYPDRKVYKLNQLNLPLGSGIRYEASPVLCFRFEIVYRKLWTDYLDDVSKTYINPADFDQYFTSSVSALATTLADRRLKSNPAFTSGGLGDIRGNPKNNDAYFSINLKIGLIFGRQKRK